MADHQTVTIEKQSLQRVAVVVPLLASFLYLSYIMLFGPCTMRLPGFKVMMMIIIMMLMSLLPTLSASFSLHVRVAVSVFVVFSVCEQCFCITMFT